MIFKQTSIPDVLIIEPDKHNDSRGFFARTFDSKQFYNEAIEFNIVQTSISYNKKKGTLRGMHYQDIPYQENKIIHCLKGSIYDVTLDLRKDSPTHKQYFSTELCDDNNLSLYVPLGIAHGLQTLEDDTTVLYYMNIEHHPEYAKTINYKSCNIKWKEEPTVISDKDRDAPLLK